MGQLHFSAKITTVQPAADMADWLQISDNHLSLVSHVLQGSASTVLTANGLVNGDGKF